MKANKYIYLHVLQGNYGFGFKDFSASESYKEIKQYLKAKDEGKLESITFKESTK